MLDALNLFAQPYCFNNSSEKFNKRGLIKDGAFQSNGKEQISEYDGNLIVKYNTPLTFPNNLGGDFTILFNSNVSHSIFPTLETNSFNVNLPEWILGYKGFAVQTLNFENNYSVAHANPNNYDLTYLGQEVPKLIPGYHYSNIMGGLNPGSSDKITILMSDGSLKNLVNVSGGNVKTGIYIDNSVDNHGIAKVDYISGSQIYRKMIYKPGDGLTYLFNEEEITFRDNVNTGNGFTPKAMILTEIISQDGDHVNFDYDYYNGDSNIGGRKLFNGLYYYHSTDLNNSNDYDLYLQYSLLDIVINNQNTGTKYTLNLCPENINGLFSNYRYNNNSKIASVSSIKDIMGRIDYYEYYKYNNMPIPPNLTAGDNTVLRQYMWDGSNQGIYWQNPYLLKHITYLNKKETKFTYYNDKYDGTESGNTPFYVIENQLPYLDYNFGKLKRDCYTSYMIKQRDIYSSASNILKTETYDYVCANGNIVLNYFYINDIITKISIYAYVTIMPEVPSMPIDSTSGDAIIENTENTPSQAIMILLTKNFTMYRTSTRASILDYCSTIKLVEDIVQDQRISTSNSKKNNYTYDIGNIIGGGSDYTYDYYDGTFKILSNSEIINGDNATIKTNTLTDIVDDEVTFTGVTTKIRIPKSGLNHDSKTLVEYTEYKNFIPYNGIIDINTTYDDFIGQFYIINLLAENKKFPVNTLNTIIKEDTYYDYISSGNLIGKLSKITHNPRRVARYVVETYDYYDPSSDLPGLLKSKIIDDISGSNKVTEQYYYTRLSGGSYTATSGIPGIITLDNGTQSERVLTRTGFQIQPFETDIFSNIPGSQNRVNFTSYDKQGNIIASIDENRNYTEYTYDVLGRILMVKLPGCFKTLNPIEDNSLGPIKYTYDDVNLKIKEEYRFTNDATNSKTRVITHTYDSMGNLITEQINNDNNTVENKISNNYDYNSNKTLVNIGSSPDIRTTKFDYDYLNRLITKSSKISTNTWEDYTTEYTYPVNQYGYQKIKYTDEKLKIVTKYFDIVGNLVRLENSNLATQYNYDEIYRLTSVHSPENKITSYFYDDLNNISQKTTPNEGTTKFKYDKYGKLRFTLYSTSNTEYIFNQYDPFKRPTIKGVNVYSNYDALDPDVDYSIDNIPLPGYYGTIPHFENLSQDQNKFLEVNYYDSNQNLFTGFANFILPTDFNALFANANNKLVGTAYRDNLTDQWNYKLYSYDYLGRVAYMWTKDSKLNLWKRIHNYYDYLDNLVKQDINGEFYYWYDYDSEGRLVRTLSNSNDYQR
jgi:YD repeat-containing protein